MRKIIIISLLLASVLAQAQRFDWVTSAGYVGVANSFYGAIYIATHTQGNAHYPDQNLIPVATDTSDTIYTAVMRHATKLEFVKLNIQ